MKEKPDTVGLQIGPIKDGIAISVEPMICYLIKATIMTKVGYGAHRPANIANKPSTIERYHTSRIKMKDACY